MPMARRRVRRFYSFVNLWNTSTVMHMMVSNLVGMKVFPFVDALIVVEMHSWA